VRIHITGMSPRMVSPRARERMTFARTLELALTELGHEVHRGSDDPWDAELVLGGVTSALSPGSTYALTGLVAVGETMRRDVPLLLFVDDPDLGKTRSAAESALRDTSRLYSDYLLGKRVRSSRNPDVRAQVSISTAIEMLATEEWPPVLVPLHPWASQAIAAKRLRVTSTVLPIDVSPVVEVVPAPAPVDGPAQMWLTDRHYSPEVLEQDRVRWPVVPIDSTTMTMPPLVYAVARGVHQGAIHRMPGWWTPTPLYVASAGTLYLCDSEESSAIGVDSPYYLTPDLVEALDSGVHRDLAGAQANHLKETTWSLDDLLSQLTDAIGLASSFAKPDTSRVASGTS
jgi:hypothetical protein